MEVNYLCKLIPANQRLIIHLGQMVTITGADGNQYQVNQAALQAQGANSLGNKVYYLILAITTQEFVNEKIF